jgi:glucokinase
MQQQDLILAIDLGGTQIRAALADPQGMLLARAATQTRAEEGPEAVIGRIIECAEQVLEGVERTRVIGVGVGAPGPINPWTGVLYNPPNLPGWEAVPLADRLAATLGLPVYAGNDANLAALGERRFGAGQGMDDLVYMTVSTGIGGGIISGGQLVVGARGFAGEIGHQTLEPDGPLCGCGQRGHLEALAAGPAIARAARRALQEGATSLMAELVDDPEHITAETVTEAAVRGDAVARQILERAGFYIGLGLVNVIHMVEPQRIIIGGGVSQAGELLFAPIRRTVAERLMSPVYRGVEIVSAALGDDVGLLGAVALVLEMRNAE